MGHAEPSVATSVPGAVRGVNDLTGYIPAQSHVVIRFTPRGEHQNQRASGGRSQLVSEHLVRRQKVRLSPWGTSL
jgi:hypothetical protein